jgi:threonine aldolase
VLVGDADAMHEARRIRKMFGGGMRQVGVLAAAGIVALDEMLPRLGEDNANAALLGQLLADVPGILLDPTTVETNIVFLRLDPEAPLTAGQLASRLADKGVLVHALGHDSVRLVTHYQVSREDVEKAAAAVREVMAEG